MINRISHWKTEKTVSLQFICFLTLFLALIARNPVWNMMWDADGYLNSAIHWVTGGPHEQVAEQLSYRGFLTSIVYYIPSFLAINFLEPTQFGSYLYVFVLAQNALIVSWMSSYVLPKIVELFGHLNNFTVVITSVLGFYALNNFVPYSLMDLWALACLLPVIYLIYSKKKTVLGFCGLLLGVCLNLRPSYLFAIVLLIGSAFCIKKISVLLMLPGLVVSQIPQLIYNSKWNDSFSIFPLGLGGITRRLATFAAYSIRYDSVAYGPLPKGGLSFCDEKMMAIALKAKPDSTFETAMLFLQNPGHSSVFIMRKLAAAFWWPVTVPYYEYNPLVNTIYGSLILLIVIFGLSKIVRAFVRTEQKKRYLGAFAVLAGFLINMVLYSNETRYGVSVVLIAICGIAIMLNQPIYSLGKINVAYFFNKENAVMLTIYLLVACVAAFTLMGNFGFQSIRNCG